MKNRAEFQEKSSEELAAEAYAATDPAEAARLAGLAAVSLGIEQLAELRAIRAELAVRAELGGVCGIAGHLFESIEDGLVCTRPGCEESRP